MNDPSPPILDARATLLAADIPAIRDLYRGGSSQREIAARFGVNQTTIWAILGGRTWAHVPDEAGPVAIRRSGARGEDCPHSRLNGEQVRAIRRELAGGARPVEMARRFGISAQAVYQIRARQTWAWLDPPAPPA